MADVQTNFGPFLAIYLEASLHWIAGLIAQTPVGALVDRLRQKREAVAVCLI